jgi:hypothetical protein
VHIYAEIHISPRGGWVQASVALPASFLKTSIMNTQKEYLSMRKAIFQGARLHHVPLADPSVYQGCGLHERGRQR